MGFIRRRIGTDKPGGTPARAAARGERTVTGEDRPNGPGRPTAAGDSTHPPIPADANPSLTAFIWTAQEPMNVVGGLDEVCNVFSSHRAGINDYVGRVDGTSVSSGPMAWNLRAVGRISGDAILRLDGSPAGQVDQTGRVHDGERVIARVAPGPQCRQAAAAAPLLLSGSRGGPAPSASATVGQVDAKRLESQLVAFFAADTIADTQGAINGLLELAGVEPGPFNQSGRSLWTWFTGWIARGEDGLPPASCVQFGLFADEYHDSFVAQAGWMAVEILGTADADVLNSILGHALEACRELDGDSLVLDSHPVPVSALQRAWSQRLAPGPR